MGSERVIMNVAKIAHLIESLIRGVESKEDIALMREKLESLENMCREINCQHEKDYDLLLRYLQKYESLLRKKVRELRHVTTGGRRKILKESHLMLLRLFMRNSGALYKNGITRLGKEYYHWAKRYYSRKAQFLRNIGDYDGYVRCLQKLRDFAETVDESAYFDALILRGEAIKALSQGLYEEAAEKYSQAIEKFESLGYMSDANECRIAHKMLTVTMKLLQSKTLNKELITELQKTYHFFRENEELSKTISHWIETRRLLGHRQPLVSIYMLLEFINQVYSKTMEHALEFMLQQYLRSLGYEDLPREIYFNNRVLTELDYFGYKKHGSMLSVAVGEARWLTVVSEEKIRKFVKEILSKLASPIFAQILRGFQALSKSMKLNLYIALEPCYLIREHTSNIHVMNQEINNLEAEVRNKYRVDISVHQLTYDELEQKLNFRLAPF